MTGNLDWYNANNLMQTLIEDILPKNSTAIIVTHDIELAVKYANKIVLIEKQSKIINQDKLNEEKVSFGLINEDFTYLKNNDNIWSSLASKQNFSNESITDFLKNRIIKQKTCKHVKSKFLSKIYWP